MLPANEKPQSPLSPTTASGLDTPSGASSLTTEQQEDARLFYERLEQTGQMVDVSPDTDLAALPPNVTHIRHQNGIIERIGYSTSLY